MKAYLIARVSTEDQEDALPGQIYRLQDYAKSKSFTPELFELKESAYKEGRKLFGQVVELIQAETEKVIVVFDKIDRYSRDISSDETRVLRKLCKTDQIEIHFPSDGLFLTSKSSAQSWFMLNMGENTAEYYSHAISDNVKRRFAQKRRDGEWTGKAPFGYNNVDIGNGKKSIVLDEYKAEAVRTAYELYATGSYSFRLIRKQLVEDYAITLSNSQLGRILQNPFYKGQMLVEGQLYPHNYDRVITEELYEEVKSVREGYKIKPKRWAGLPYQYRGLIKCSDCGCRITFEKKKGKYVYGHCTQYKGKHKATYVNENELTKQLKTVFERIQLPKEAYNEINDELRKSFDEDNQKNVNKLSQIEAEIKKCENRIDRLYEDHIDNKVSEEFYDRKFKDYTQTLKNYKKQKITFELPVENRFDRINYLLEVLKNAPVIFEDSKIEKKRSMLNLVLSNLELNDNQLRWEVNFPFDTAIKCNESSNWLGFVSNYGTFLTPDPDDVSSKKGARDV